MSEEKFEQEIPIPDSATSVKLVVRSDQGFYISYVDEHGNNVKIGYYEIESES